MTWFARVPLGRDGPGYLYMGSKTAYVALHGLYVAQLRPHVPPLGPHVPQLGRPELPKRLPESMFDRFWSPRDLEKPPKVLYGRRISRFSQFRKGSQKQMSKKLALGRPKVALGRPRWTPGAPQERPQSRQKSLAHKSLQELILDTRPPLRGTIF